MSLRDKGTDARDYATAAGVCYGCGGAIIALALVLPGNTITMILLGIIGAMIGIPASMKSAQSLKEYRNSKG